MAQPSPTAASAAATATTAAAASTPLSITPHLSRMMESSASTASLSTQIMLSHQAALLTPRKQQPQRDAAKSPRTPARNYAHLANEEKMASTPLHKQQLIDALTPAPAALQALPPDITVRGRMNRQYHHLPPMSEAEKTILFEALPTLKQMDDVGPAHSPELRQATLSIIRQWLQDKLSTSKWVSLIKSIRMMAEGGEHTQILEKQNVLQVMGLDSRSLHSAGVPPSLTSRIYKGLWVYSLGMHELVTEVAHHSRNNHQIVGNVWKAYSILLEDFQGEEYVMALLQVEAESQRVLKQMEERFGKSLQFKQDNEVKTQTEVKTLSALLERSQHESRTLLEKKESLLLDIHHLESLNADLETSATQAKKELWFTSNALNRTTGKLEQLQKSSAAREERLLADIHDLRLEGEEMKASLDQELSTNESLSYKVDRLGLTLTDLTSNITRLQSELSERGAELSLATKVLEKTSLELATVERKSLESAVVHAGALREAQDAISDLEARIQTMEDEDELRVEREGEERARVAAEAEERERLAALASPDEAAESPLVLDLRAQVTAVRQACAKELAELTGRNSVMTERIRTMQKRIRELGGGGPRFARGGDEDGISGGARHRRDRSTDASPPMSPHGSGDYPTRLGKRDDDESSSASSSASNSRRSSRTHSLKSTMGKRRSGHDLTSGQSIEVSQLQSALESKEKLNTNLLVSINKLKVQLTQQGEEARKKAEAAARVSADLAQAKEALHSEQALRGQFQKQVFDLSAEVDRLTRIEVLYTEQGEKVSDLQKQKIHTLSENLDLNASILERTKESKELKKELKAAKANLAKLKDDLKDLGAECDQRSKNQNELGLRIRTLNMENESLQSLNDEIQRNMKSSVDNSSLLGSLEAKGAEINRLALKIRDMEHARIELIKTHEVKMQDARGKSETEALKKAEDAMVVEVTRQKKLRSQLTEQKNEHTRIIEDLRLEADKKEALLAEHKAVADKSSKEVERLQKLLDARAASVMTNPSVPPSPAMKALPSLQAIPPPFGSLHAEPGSSESSSHGTPSFSASPIPPDVAAILLLPPLAELGVSELSSLLNGAAPSNPQALASALKDVSASLAESIATAKALKESRNTLQEENFMKSNQIAVLQEQIDSLKGKYRDVVAKLAPDGERKQHHQNKRSIPNAAAIDNAEHSGSEDEERRGVRFARSNNTSAVPYKRSSRTGSMTKAGRERMNSDRDSLTKDDERVVGQRRSTLINKSPRSTLTRTQVPQSPSATPGTLRTPDASPTSTESAAAAAAIVTPSTPSADDIEHKVLAPSQHQRSSSLENPAKSADGTFDSPLRKMKRRTKLHESDVLSQVADDKASSTPLMIEVDEDAIDAIRAATGLRPSAPSSPEPNSARLDGDPQHARGSSEDMADGAAAVAATSSPFTLASSTALPLLSPMPPDSAATKPDKERARLSMSKPAAAAREKERKTSVSGLAASNSSGALPSASPSTKIKSLKPSPPATANSAASAALPSAATVLSPANSGYASGSQTARQPRSSPPPLVAPVFMQQQSPQMSGLMSPATSLVALQQLRSQVRLAQSLSFPKLL